jgi:hypothetical protein
MKYYEICLRQGATRKSFDSMEKIAVKHPVAHWGQAPSYKFY